MLSVFLSLVSWYLLQNVFLDIRPISNPKRTLFEFCLVQDFCINNETTGIFHFVLLCRVLLIISIIGSCHLVYLATAAMKVGDGYKIALTYTLRNQDVHYRQKYGISRKHNGNTFTFWFVGNGLAPTSNKQLSRVMSWKMSFAMAEIRDTQ